MWIGIWKRGLDACCADGAHRLPLKAASGEGGWEKRRRAAEQRRWACLLRIESWTGARCHWRWETKANREILVQYGVFSRWQSSSLSSSTSYRGQRTGAGYNNRFVWRTATENQSDCIWKCVRPDRVMKANRAIREFLFHSLLPELPWLSRDARAHNTLKPVKLMLHW